MFDFEIAQYLYRVAFLYEKLYDSIYKSRAYYKAALAVDGYSTAVEKLCKEKKLRSLPSIGISIEKNITEIVETGNLALIGELLGDIPPTIFDLYEHVNIKDRLFKTLIKNRIFDFEQISVSVEKPTSNYTPQEIEILRSACKIYKQRHFQYAQVYEIASELILALKRTHLVKEICMSDDLYFHCESLETGDIVCTTTLTFSDFIIGLQSLTSFQVVYWDEYKVLLKRFHIPFRLYILSEDDFTKKMECLNSLRKNISLTAPCKNAVLKFMGDLHLHTSWSDGLHSIEDMYNVAIKMGYSYIAITDHSRSLKPSGMSILDTLTQIKKIREMNKKTSIPILAGIEVDILADGSLDLPNNILQEFDIVIAAIHSYFNQPPIILIERISRALSNKYVNILAHPTGRLLGRPGKPTVQREGFPLNFDYLLKVCRENNVALEVNCFPERFDLSLDNVKKAVLAGVKISVGTDAHSVYHMSCAKYALEAFKFANIPADAVLNCYPFDKLKRILAKKKGNTEFVIGRLFEEKPKDFSHYFVDSTEILLGRVKAVGIDLTGSEEKASGFAVLSGALVDTMPVLTDDEIIKHICEIRPEIVSIDSPLSLPAGRCCGNKNCECAKYGIMRYSEVTLKRFGIGVYPCLIDSMVNLTMRGMKLTARLRKLGFTVIESYPGVAQDLLHIPRKRKGLELLINGMKNFGIQGIRSDVSHDEVDAVTSALVGYFYLNNKFVGMGNEKEDYLIVPKLETDLTGKGLVIGLVGHIASGKTTITEYLRFRYGFTSMRFSQIIEDKYKVFGRDDLQRIGLEIANDSVKQKELSDCMLNNMKSRENYVIDGIRQMIDYENLSNSLGKRFILLNVKAPFQIRANRYCKLYPAVTKSEFVKIDAHKVENAIDRISCKYDDKIINNKSYKELMEELDALLAKWSN
jgi:histidinol phosphatase-like PHP family hydrolase/predicted nuclease with RNAse H fold/dephospho-CoA kinase